MASYYGAAAGPSVQRRKLSWYSDAELSSFPAHSNDGQRSAGDTAGAGGDGELDVGPAAGLTAQHGKLSWYGDAEPSNPPPRADERQRSGGGNARTSGDGDLDQGTSVGTQRTEVASAPSGQPSFYGQGPKLHLNANARSQKPARPKAKASAQSAQVLEAPLEAECPAPAKPGESVSVVPKRPPRAADCRSLDKEISGGKSMDEVFAVAMQDESALDAANWANLVYALAHVKKHGGAASMPATSALKVDPRWRKSCDLLRPMLSQLTARDASNVLWSLATLELRGEPLYVETADALCSGGKLSVCDPVSVSKAAWALTSVGNRDRRLELFTQLAVPVVLRADAFPLGALTMTAYSFAKADHRDADVYEALASALAHCPDEELRPIDVCNVIWAFCTVGYRDDALFTRLCDCHLARAEVVAHFNPQDLTNTAWGLSKVGYLHHQAMNELALAGMQQVEHFQPIHFTNLFYAFATLRLPGPGDFLSTMADGAVAKLAHFDCGNLAISAWAFAQLRQQHRLLDEALVAIQKPELCTTVLSRTLSMLFLAFFRMGRVADVDSVFRSALACGMTIGSSGFSSVMMTAEQDGDADREVRLLQAMAKEAGDDRMWAAIGNSAVIRLMKRQCLSQAWQLLCEIQAAGQHRWTAVSTGLHNKLTRMRVAPQAVLESHENWEAPVKSGLHPIAATRQNEGPHAYTREFMTLQAVMCMAPQDDVDACMAAVEEFAESRSLWLKITAWEKATVVHEVARLARPQLVLEIGAYVGYSAMNLARAVRPHGGRVVSLEVDPIHVTVVRNMVEYAGVSDSVDVWTGYCYDVIPHLLHTYGPHSFDMVFMDQKGTRFHTDLELMEELGLLADGAVVLADNVLKPGAPLYIWHLTNGPYTYTTAVSVREFMLQSEDWMVMAFHDASRPAAAQPPPLLRRLAFESDSFRKRSMFDSIAPSKSDWWAFSHRFVDGLDQSGVKPHIVGLHGRENPVIKPEDIAGIFRRAKRLPEPAA